jgi:DNA-binding NarL/FixJ family response regulator
MDLNRRILLIDDSPAVLKAFRTVLSLHPSWEIVGEASNGLDGIALYRALAPNVVILDYQMPGMTGVDVGLELRGMGFEGLLILFSLHAGPELNALAREVGFDAVLPKNAPFPIVTIIEKMSGEMTRTKAAIAASSNAKSSC